jgi:hypothetical protein
VTAACRGSILEQAAVASARSARRPKESANRERTLRLDDYLRRHYRDVAASRMRDDPA